MLSIIIPTLNAEGTLETTLTALIAPEIPGVEVIVVDGGSDDGTLAIVKDSGAVLVEGEAGRGRQLARGAEAAQAEWLMFLHADTRLPDDWAAIVSRFITADENQEYAAYFHLGFDASSSGAARVAALANWRAKVWGLPYGDQGLLIHRSLYDKIGGYRAELNLMEDVDFAQRLGPMRLKRLPARITTSAAKYERGGWWARPTRNLICLFMFLLGLPQRWIERLYR